MLRTIGERKSCQHAGVRCRFPERRLHIVDIENLAGASLPGLGEVREVRALYTERLAFGSLDQVEIASSHLTLLNMALGWPQAHYRVRSGPNGADLALLDVLHYENIPARFTCGDRLWRWCVRRTGGKPGCRGRLGDRDKPAAQSVIPACARSS